MIEKIQASIGFAACITFALYSLPVVNENPGTIFLISTLSTFLGTLE